MEKGIIMYNNGNQVVTDVLQVLKLNFIKRVGIWNAVQIY